MTGKLMNHPATAPDAIEDSVTIVETPHPCESGWAVIVNGEVVEEETCGAPSTHQVLHTCCTHVKHVCENHAAEHLPGTTGEFCVKCSHSCPWGVCHHRVVIPL